MKVIVGEFHQETNSFNSREWTLDEFRNDTVLFGDDILKSARSNGKRIFSGIIGKLDEVGAEIVPTSAFRSISGGSVSQSVIEMFIDSLREAWAKNTDADAIVLGLHGATKGTGCDDVCGLILSTARQLAGPDVVIAAGMDFHANVTPLCIESADFICGFQTYPHVDQYETGYRAATLAVGKLAGERRFLAYGYLPMIVPASGYNTNEGTMAKAVGYGKELVASGVLEDFTLFQMQPWLDVDPAGSAVIAVSKSADAARDAVARISEMVFSARDEFWPVLENVDDIIRYAAGKPLGIPAVLVDYADSPGGGAIGDNASVLSRLKALGYPVKCAMGLTDPKSVDIAMKAKVGDVCHFHLGEGNGSCEVDARIMSFHDGVFYQEGPMSPGQVRKLGRTVIINVQNVDIVLCDHVCAAGDLQFYRAFGLDPCSYALLCVKANTSYRACYSKITLDFHVADTEGVNSARLRDLPYKTIVREGFYPFDHLDGYKVPEPRVFER